MVKYKDMLPPQPHHQSSTRYIYIILNPNAGRLNFFIRILANLFGWNTIQKQSITQIIKTITTFFNTHGCKVDVVTTQQKDHAYDLAKHASKNEQINTIVAMGGDGTINEVVNGMFGSSKPLGVIPYGTANIFGLSFNLSKDLLAACQTILNQHTTTIDVGCINGHYFVCMAGIGFDAYVIKKTDQYLKKYMGPLGYVVTALLAFFKYRFRPILFRINHHKKTYRGYFLIILNTPYYGGRFMLSTQASPNNGNLTAYIVKKNGFLNALLLAYYLAKKSNKAVDLLEEVQCHHIHIRALGKHRIHCDAESVLSTPAHIQVHPQSLQVIIDSKH